MVLVAHVNKMIFGKLHSCDSSLPRPCRALASRTVVIFVELFCPYQDVMLKEWYVPTAIHLDDTVLEELVAQLPYPQINDVLSIQQPIFFIELLASSIRVSCHNFPYFL